MKHRFELPTPPATRVVSVGCLRHLDHDIDLDAFTDCTLAEVQHVASRFTDDGAEVLVSIVVETQTHRETGQASVPLEWFQQQIRMRQLVNPPDDVSALETTADTTAHRRSDHRGLETAKRLATIGFPLATAWKKRFRSRIMIPAATISWIDLIAQHDPDLLHESAGDIREIASRTKIRRHERRRIANFCLATCEDLISDMST
jgi:hypothetical protein